jgi:acyl carrier protein
MPETPTIEERLRQFVLKHFPLARKAHITDDTDWLQGGIIDSLGMLDLVQFIEKEFSVVISDEELAPENFQSLSSVADFVRRKVPPQA